MINMTALERILMGLGFNKFEHRHIGVEKEM